MAEIAERTRYFERYVTFIDAIVAIAITLLVLPLVELTSDHHGTTSELLRDHAAQFYSFALSFLVIFRLWWSQHRLLRFVVDGDKVVVRGLGLWVMTIVFLPFPTALVAAPSQDLGTRGSLHRDNGSQCCVPGGGRVGSGPQPVVERREMRSRISPLKSSLS